MQNFFLTLQYTDGIYRKSCLILAKDKGNLQALLCRMNIEKRRSNRRYSLIVVAV
jgi:hypothetical protein